jgi:DNA-binding NarL/FixJ family response regulator
MDRAEQAISIIVVDDHEMFADSISRVLSRQPDMTVAGITGTMAEALKLAESARPDVAVLDYHLPDGDGAALAARLRTLVPDTRVLMVTGMDDERVLIAAIDAGCSGFVTKDKALTELIDAVRLVHAGDAYMPPNLLARLLPRMGKTYRGIGTDLTRREREVMNLLAKGLSNQSIADQLVLSVHTIRNHVQSVLAKLHAHSKLEAVAIAAREGLLDRHR